MSQSATARAQAVQMLDEAATAIKRADRANKQALRAVRQAQAMTTGIQITSRPGGEDARSQDEARA